MTTKKKSTAMKSAKPTKAQASVSYPDSDVAAFIIDTGPVDQRVATEIRAKFSVVGPTSEFLVRIGELLRGGR